VPLLVQHGRTNRETARYLNISNTTVNKHVLAILTKLDAKNCAHAANLVHLVVSPVHRHRKI